MKMTKWMERKLSELGEITTGKTPPSSQPKFYGGNIPFVTPSDMDIRRTIDTTARYLTNAGALNVRSSFIDKPAICVSCIGSDMGKAVLVDQPFVSNQQINSIVVYEYVERLFVYYNLLGRKDEIRFKASGAAQPIMNKSDFGRLTLRIPDQPTQKRIAKVLGSLDDKIELNRRMNETLEEMARALFRDWFIDFGPTRRQMDGATDPAAIMGHAFPDDKAAPLAPLFPARLGDNGLPEGWNWGAVSDLADLNPKSWTVKKHPEQVDYLDLGNTKWGIIEETISYLWSEAPSRAKRILEPGDTIVGTVRPGNGSYALIGREGLTGSTGFAVLRPKHRSVTEFVYLALTSSENIDILANLADGGAYPAINPKVVADTKIVLADSKAIEDFSNLTQSMFAKRHFNEQESQTLTQIRDLLLPKLMSGEIQLKDAPIVQDTLDGQPIQSSQLGTRKNLSLGHRM